MLQYMMYYERDKLEKTAEYFLEMRLRIHLQVNNQMGMRAVLPEDIDRTSFDQLNATAVRLTILDQLHQANLKSLQADFHTKIRLTLIDGWPGRQKINLKTITVLCGVLCCNVSLTTFELNGLNDANSPVQ